MPQIPAIVLGDDTNMPSGVRMYGHRIRVKAEPETPGQRARLQDPRLKLHSALDPFEAMSRMLLALGRVGFDVVLGFRGPVVDPTPDRKEGLHVRDVVAQLRALEDPRAPLGGLKAEVRYRRDARVRAIVTVGSMRPAKAKVRVKGAVLKSDWFGLKKQVEKNLEDIDAG
jgi:hypothetical protein